MNYLPRVRIARSNGSNQFEITCLKIGGEYGVRLRSPKTGQVFIRTGNRWFINDMVTWPVMTGRICQGPEWEISRFSIHEFPPWQPVMGLFEPQTPRERSVPIGDPRYRFARLTIFNHGQKEFRYPEDSHINSELIPTAKEIRMEQRTNGHVVLLNTLQGPEEIFSWIDRIDSHARKLNEGGDSEALAVEWILQYNRLYIAIGRENFSWTPRWPKP